MHVIADGPKATSVLATELDVFSEQLKALLGSAEGKYVLIKDHEVIGTYDSQQDAITIGYERFGNVPFLVKQILRTERPQKFVSGLLAV